MIRKYFFLSRTRYTKRTEKEGKRERKGKEGGKAVPLFPLFPLFRFASVPLPCVPPFRRSFLCVLVLPAFRCAFRSFLRYAVRSVCVPFASLCCAAVRFRFRSVSVLLAAGQHRTGQQGSTGTKQGHGDRLERLWLGRNEGGGVGDTRHFVVSFHYKAHKPTLSVTLYIRMAYGGTPLRHFVHSFTLQGGAILSFRSFVPLVLPGGLLVFLLSFPFRPACSSEFLVSFQERSSAWKWWKIAVSVKYFHFLLRGVRSCFVPSVARRWYVQGPP